MLKQEMLLEYRIFSPFGPGVQQKVLTNSSDLLVRDGKFRCSPAPSTQKLKPSKSTPNSTPDSACFSQRLWSQFVGQLL